MVPHGVPAEQKPDSQLQYLTAQVLRGAFSTIAQING
jgi:hypothetical protein